MVSKGCTAQKQIALLLDSVERLQKEFDVDMDWEPTVCSDVSSSEPVSPRTVEDAGAIVVCTAAPDNAVARKAVGEDKMCETSGDEEMGDAEGWILVEGPRRRSTM